MGRFGSLDDWNVNHQLLQELSNRSSNGSGFSRENSQTGLAFPEGLPDGFNLFRTNIGCHLRRKLLTLTQISNQLLSFSNTFDHACRITTMSKDGRIILAAGKKTILVWDFNTKNLIRNISPKSIIKATSEKEEIFKLFLDQEPIVKKDPKARKEPIKPTNVSPVTIPTVPQETISTISRRSSISSIESINLQDYPPLQERRERLIEKLHN
ncbi:hypothetical protein GLOIN_2v1789097 [Rhizophagus irregularis DAOM 181602=DAOM 197198]|uniref:Uncharacterized protein n=1 Tax=Rhizophagus irregularis (strain DAOM 181602 / DAOM 197198 / MUCL 43194) TaxID=747089 RepID=A0A2P4P262_RHIID|nr:hypothetical protein GLOIN_2v1789097 [Rhizophagus irregularis DAOM 181602=DAOM 197198]POG59476.1 hypothetical protein GLOIN_2v1789097 [Rhizophagus irregularis DAOM 181602=DAOM 197198]|eukprot:XP_025166342.1 hypothetical protein GLOIN_2v1789097 [Rhizophagus irregularis DAOM 181602=DAOM 197198]